MGSQRVDRAPAEPEVDLEPSAGMDLLELNHELGAQVHELEAVAASQARIGIATGLVMAQHRIGVDDALTVLRQASDNSNRELRDVAESVISAGRLSLVPVRAHSAQAVGRERTGEDSARSAINQHG